MSCYQDRRVDFRHPKEGETQVNLTENAVTAEVAPAELWRLWS
jgi:hypothetical protein